jgi:hypothetical protein
MRFDCGVCGKYLGDDMHKLPEDVILSPHLGAYCSKKCWEQAKAEFIECLNKMGD